MNQITKWLRKNIGLIVSIIGVVLLVILTFGDMGELFTEKYWENVGGNLSSISALTIGLVMIQTTIKQGVSEQALSAGLNKQETKDKYDEHKKVRKECREKEIYLPYFLDLRNRRETKRKKREFLIDNNFTSEKKLFASGNNRLINKYNQIQINITADSIKWSTTEIVFKKNGQIEKLDAHRKKRAVKGFLTGIAWMLGATLITGGLFLDTADIPLVQKVIKLFSYFLTIAFSVVFDICREYEKGAFGVPNELEEVNGIWEEFKQWEVPDWVEKEVEANNLPEDIEYSQPKQDVQSQVEETPLENIESEEKEPENVPILLGYDEEKEIEEEIVYESKREELDTRTDVQEESIQSEVV
jgi:hypothetical protein